MEEGKVTYVGTPQSVMPVVQGQLRELAEPGEKHSSLSVSGRIVLFLNCFS